MAMNIHSMLKPLWFSTGKIKTNPGNAGGVCPTPEAAQRIDHWEEFRNGVVN